MRSDHSLDNLDYIYDRSSNAKVFDTARILFPSLAISHVCRTWRSLAIDTPLLWSPVDVLPPWNLNRLSTILTRSKSCPISLNLIAREGFSEFLMTTTRSKGLCDIIKSHAYHFRKISFYVDRTFVHLLPPLREMLQDLTTPELIQISLRGTGQYQQLSQRNAMFGARGAPLVCDARLGHLGIRSFYLSSSVTTLHLDAKKARMNDSPNDPGNIYLPEFLAMMTTCPFLEKLVVHGDILPCNDFQSLRTPLYVFASLTSLELYNTFGVLNAIVTKFMAPALHHLVMLPMFTSEVVGITDRQKFEKNFIPFPALKSLTIIPYDECRCVEPKFYVQASRCFPDIEQLNLDPHECDGFYDGEDELPWMFTKTEDGILWPKMRTLGLQRDCCHSKYVWKHLFRAVSFRYEQGYPIKRIFANHSILDNGIVNNIFHDNLSDSSSDSELEEERVEELRVQLEWIKTHVEVVKRDVWSELLPDGLYSIEEVMATLGS